MRRIEKEIWEVWNEAKEAFPTARGLSFNISETAGKMDDIWGFLHIGLGIKQWNNLDELYRRIKGGTDG